MALFNDDPTKSPLDGYAQDNEQRSFDGWDPVGEDSWFDPWESLQEGMPQGELGITAAEQGVASTLRERHRRVDLGIEQRSSYGLAGEFGAAVGRGLFQTTKSTVNTVEELLGVHDDPNSLSYEMDQYLRTHQAGILGRGADTLAEKAVASIGEQAPIIAAIIGTGIATGGTASALGLGTLGTKSLVTAGTMTTMSAMTFGDNTDAIRAAAGGRLDESTIFGLSVMSTLIQSSLEAVIGPEALIGKTISLQAMAAAKKPLAEMFAIASKKTLFSGVKGFGASVFAESGTEAAQSIVQSMWEDIAEGPGISMGKEEFMQAMTEALYAIPTAAVFGGFASISEHMVKSGIIQRYKKLEASKEAVTAGLDKKRTAVYHEIVDTAYAKFEENLSPKFGREGARSISEILKETAYHWAANGGKAPEALIETFDVILSDTELSESQIQEVRKITDPVERVKWMRNNVQGYREFEAQQIEEYRARGVDQQYQYDLNRFRNIFGEDFGADLVPLEKELADAQDEQSDQAAEGGQITEQEKKQDVVAIHAAALGRLNDLHQMAAERVADLDIPGNANKRRVVDSITTETASRMFRAMSDPDADTSWIRPEAMKETLINMIALNNSRVPRVDAALFVNKISQTTETRGVGKTPLESVFMTEAIKTQTEGYYNSDELVEMGKKIAQNADAWDFIMRSDMKTHMIEVLHSRKAELELTAEQEAQLDNLAIEDAIIQSENEYGRSLTEQEIADIIDAADVGAFDAIIDRITRERELDNLAAEEAIRDSEEEYGRNLTEQEVQEIIDSLDIDGLDSIADIEAENFAARERLRIMKALQELPDTPGSGADTLDVGGKRRAAELEELRRARQEKIEVMMALRELPDLLESGNETGSRIFAHYDSKNRRAIFYKNATAEDVLHEWFHHVDLNNLLPASMRADMNVQYGITEQSTQAEKTEARERAARDFVTFIRAQVDGGTPGQDYPERLEDTFNYLSAVFAEEWHADKGFEVNGEQAESSSQGLPPPAGLIAAINSVDTKMGDMLNQAKDNAKQRTLDLFNNPETRQELEYTEALSQFNKDAAELALPDEQVEIGKEWLAKDYGTGQQMFPFESSIGPQSSPEVSPDNLGKMMNAFRKLLRTNPDAAAQLDADMDALENEEKTLTDQDLYNSLLGALGNEQAVEAFLEENEIDITRPGGNQQLMESSTAGQDSLGFYSQLARTVGALGQETFEPKQLLGVVKKAPGVKAEELADIGFEDWLKGLDGKVTKAQALEFIRNGGPQIQEVVKGEANLPDEYSIREDEYYDAITDEDRINYVLIGPEGQSLGSYDDRETAITDAKLDAGISFDNETKFGQYQLPGGENYREVLLTLPTTDSVSMQAKQARIDALMEEGRRNPERQEEIGRRVDAILNEPLERISTDYRSSHWDEPNVLAHFRLNDRIGPNGERILFIEEIQSDWHQGGRKKGYGTPEIDTTGWEALPHEFQKDMWVVYDADGFRVDVISTNVASTPEQAMQKAVELRKRKEGGTPNAPFKKSWAMLAFKRVLRMAAEQGYDSVAWTPAHIQSERYTKELQGKVESLAWRTTETNRKSDLGPIGTPVQTLNINTKSQGVIQVVYDAEGGIISGPTGTDGKSLEDLLGKSVAQEILSSKTGEIQKEGLHVGGELFRKLYDSEGTSDGLPKLVGKYAKKMGGKVGTVGINGGSRGNLSVEANANGDFFVARDGLGATRSFETAEEARAELIELRATEEKGTEVWNLPITDQMAEKFTEEGQPLYSDNSLDYKPEVREFFDGMFENATIEEHHKTLAKILKRSLSEAPPINESGLYESQSAVTMTDRGQLGTRAHLGGHAQFIRRLKAVMGDEAYSQWDRKMNSIPFEQLREVARMAETETTEAAGSGGVLTMGANGTPFYHPAALDRYAAIEFDGAPYEALNEEQKQRVQSILSSVYRRAEKADLQKKAKARSTEKAVAEAKAQLLKTTRVIGSVGSDQRARAGSGDGAPVRMTQRALSSVGKALRTVNAWVESRFSDTFGLLRYLDDGNDVDGIYTTVIGDPFREMTKLANEAIIESNQKILENAQKYGAPPNRNEWSKTYSFGKDGIVLTLSEAIGIYMYTDRGRSKLDKQALQESNRDKLGDNIDSVISDVIKFIETDYKVYVRHNGKGDYSYSKTARDGFTETRPAMNYIKAEMEMMKWYHPMLDKVHSERTGKRLGNQLAPITVKDAEGNKSTYQRQYFLPGMRRGRQWSRGSAMADVFVENEEVREAIVSTLYPGRTYEQLTNAEQREVNRREDHYNDAKGITDRRPGGKKSDVVGIVQKKQRGAKGPEILLNAADVFETYRAQADIFRSKAKTLDYLKAIVESEEMQNSLRQTVGYDNADRFHSALIEMVKRQRFVNGKVDVETDFDRALGNIKSKSMVAILGMRASSMLMQTASGPRVLGEISAKDWSRFAVNGAKIAKAIGGNTHRIADVLLSRHNVFTEGDVGEMFNRIKKNNPDIINRMVDPDLQDRYSSRYRNTGASALTLGKGSLVDVGMGGFRVMDMATVLNVYTTSYESKVRELSNASVYGGKTMSAEQIEAAANKFAADVVNRTQPGSGVTSRNLMQTARESYRVWYPFTGDTMKQFQYLRHDIVQPLYRAARDGGIKGLASAVVTGQYGRTSVGKKAMFSVLLPMTMASLIRRRRLPEDEREWAQDMLAYTFGTIPVIGPVIQNAISNGYASADNIAMAPFVSAAKSVTYFKKGEELKGVDQFLKAISTGTGAPLVLIPWIEKVCDEMIGSGQLAPEDETKVEEYLRLLSLRVAPLPSEED